MHPVCISRNIKDEIKVKEKNPPVINQRCVVLKCDLCEADYVEHTCHFYTISWVWK